MMRCLWLLLLLPLLTAFGRNDDTSEARRDANRFILEKLERRDGESWQRSGRYFLWTYRFSRDGCELGMRREAVQGDEILTQRIPLRDVVPLWMGNASLGLYCQSTTGCIDFETFGGSQGRREGQLSETSLLIPQPDDLPKLMDAFGELHRLCDDAYARPPY